jgi:hypothetical protein
MPCSSQGRTAVTTAKAKHSTMLFYLELWVVRLTLAPHSQGAPAPQEHRENKMGRPVASSALLMRV